MKTEKAIIKGFILIILLLGLGIVVDANGNTDVTLLEKLESVTSFNFPSVSEPEITLLKRLESAFGGIFGTICYYFLTFFSLLIMGLFFAIFYFKMPLGGIMSCIAIYAYLLLWFYVNGNGEFLVGIVGAIGLFVAVGLFLKLLIMEA